MEQAIEICNYHPNYGEHAYARNFLGEEIPMNQIERLKYVLLDKEQLLLFNQIPNKRISINELHIKKQQDNWVEN